MKTLNTLQRLFFISLFCAIAISLRAELLTGNCGEKLLWSFDTETEHLDITGSGKMNLTQYPAWTKKNITIHSISFSDSITSIDNYAFEEQALTEVVIPASVKKFGSRAFADNHSLLRFEYNGEGYCEIGDKVLYNCKNLRYFKGATKMLAYNDALDTVIVTYGYALTNFYERTYIDNTLAYDTRLSGKYDERPKKIKTFFFPSQIEVIGDYLLCNAVELSGIVIPHKTKTIGKSSFLNCSSLDSLVFMGDAIESIGDSAFCNCSSLAYIRLEDTIPPTIDANTFQNVDHSIPVYIPSNAKERYQQAPYWQDFTNFITPPSADTEEEDTTSAFGSYSNTEDTNVKKVLIKGNIFILRGGKTYNITGQEL